MTLHRLAGAAALALLCAACSTNPSNSSASAQQSAAPAAKGSQAAAANSGAKGNVRMVKSRDGSFEGEVVGTPHAKSRFAKLQIGMNMSEAQDVLGRAPDRSHTYESGKRWIPFYFGNDARRMQVLYKGEGCLTFTDGNAWGGAGGDLIGINFDASGACYQP